MPDDRASEDTPTKPATPRLRGFAAMTSERRQEIAASGGRGVHALGKSYKFTSQQAKEAGQKGGLKTSENRKFMAQIGRLGGEAKARRNDDALNSAAIEEKGKAGKKAGAKEVEPTPLFVLHIHLHLGTSELRTQHEVSEPNIAVPLAEDGMPFDRVEFGKAVRKRRTALSVSQELLAHIAGITEATVRNVEFAHRVTTPKVRSWIIAALAKLDPSTTKP